MGVENAVERFASIFLGAQREYPERKEEHKHPKKKLG